MLEQYAAELRGTPLSYFVTLTYAPAFLPANGVCKRDVQLFLKRLRITLERKFNIPPFRYCVFSEYGKDTHRAHYHMILFGVDLGKLTYPFHVLQKYIRKTWKKGLSMSSHVMIIPLSIFLNIFLKVLTFQMEKTELLSCF